MLGNLTEREVDVCRELLRGQTNQEIGDALGIAERTVKTHLWNIAIKLATRKVRTHIAFTLIKASRQYPLVAAALDLGEIT